MESFFGSKLTAEEVLSSNLSGNIHGYSIRADGSLHLQFWDHEWNEFYSLATSIAGRSAAPEAAATAPRITPHSTLAERTAWALFSQSIEVAEVEQRLLGMVPVSLSRPNNPAPPAPGNDANAAGPRNAAGPQPLKGKKRAAEEEAVSPRAAKVAYMASDDDMATEFTMSPTNSDFQPGTAQASPAPSTPANTSGSTPSNLNVLRRVQNNDNYGLGLKGRVSYDCRPPMNVDISLRELLTFLPNSTQIPEVADRFMRNGVLIKQAAKMMLHPVGEMNKKNVLTIENRLKKQYSTAGKLIYKGWMTGDVWEKKHAMAAGVQPDLSANGWRFRSWHAGKGGNFVDYKLVDIANAVPQEAWPKGDDALFVTKCLDYAVDHPEDGWDTSHWDVLITALGLAAPPAPASFPTRDHEALKRFMEEVPNPEN